jgi:hypothetical protein
MLSRLFPVLLTLALIASAPAFAQNKVRTETIRPPAKPEPPKAAPSADEPAKTGSIPADNAAPAEIITDLTRLPVAVARMRERILAAARSGDLQKLVTVMQSNETMPVFSFSNEKDPAAYWRRNYPDSGGIELLSILITVLETGFVHAERGTPQEVYLWPYFARTRLTSLTPEQKVELFRLITGSDFKEMVEFGAYQFYRLGIGPDGTWHFFVAGD